MGGRSGTACVRRRLFQPHTFLADLPSPLEATGRAFVRGQLAELRERLGERLAPDDVQTLKRLVDAQAANGVMRCSDVFFRAADRPPRQRRIVME